MNNTIDMRQMLDKTEAARVLGVNKQTLALWRCVKRYPLRYCKIGRAVRYRLGDLEKFIAERTIDPQAANR